APAITVATDNKSYVIKLECVGCPFRVREYGQIAEYWQEPPRDNSLLLNFTVNAADATLILNGRRIAPLATPAAITAYQVNANLSQRYMDKMVEQHMLDESWVVGTRYGHFELQYEHTMLATEQALGEWLQFDVTAIHMRQNYNPGSFNLDNEGQNIVQLLLAREMFEDKARLFIKDIQLIERKDREMPMKMPCGKDAMIKTSYNPLEWDYYGKFGTWSRSFSVILNGIGDFFDANGLIIIIVSVLFGIASIVRWRINRNKARAIELVKEDAEAGVLLAPEYEDAPPEYADIPQILVIE
ncbi:hypothetical protein BDV96DRAFT_469196, partial [Lophiotrema nucula]